MSGRQPTWLVTGGSGFLGRHLLNRLDREPVDVVALGRRAIPGRRFTMADLLDGDRLNGILAEAAPAVIFHLAGRTPPADAESLDRSNRVATLRLIEAISCLDSPARLIVAGSAAELGPVPIEELPVGEDHPAGPETDYGRSKLAATQAALDAGGIVARVFNPIGPGTPPSQALGRFAAILADGDGPLTLHVGDLASRRDFIDGRDVADALLALARKARPGLYHVGTGESRSVGEGLELLIGHSGRPVRVNVDRSRPSGPPDSRADISRIRREIGWSPRIPFEQSVADLWAEARSRLTGPDDCL
jgi:GDP-4-dehydro-6-deoxy-D-mannose reductase